MSWRSLTSGRVWPVHIVTLGSPAAVDGRGNESGPAGSRISAVARFHYLRHVSAFADHVGVGQCGQQRRRPALVVVAQVHGYDGEPGPLEARGVSDDLVGAAAAAGAVVVFGGVRDQRGPASAGVGGKVCRDASRRQHERPGPAAVPGRLAGRLVEECTTVTVHRARPPAVNRGDGARPGPSAQRRPTVIPQTFLVDTFAEALPSRRRRSSLIGIAVHSGQTMFFFVVALALVLR